MKNEEDSKGEEESSEAPLSLLQLPVARRSLLALASSPFSLSLSSLPHLRNPFAHLRHVLLPFPNPIPNNNYNENKSRKKNPLARFLARHGASLSLVLLVVLGLGAAAHLRQAHSCSQLTSKLHHDITELQNEHGHAVSSSDATLQQAGELQHQLDEARRELAAARAASAERDRRLAEAEAAAHGHAASAHGSSAETQALRSRADTLALSLAAAERERDEARHLLEAEKALLLRKEAEWKASAEAAAAHAKSGESYGGHQGDGDNDHTGFLQVAKLLEDQGVTHPQGHRAMASSLARFFEDQMASALSSAEQGHAMPDLPVHDVSTKLISHLSHAGVASSHGVEHLFQTVDHLVDAALSHWRPPQVGAHHEEAHHEGAQAAAAAGHHEEAHHDAHDSHAAASAHHEAAAQQQAHHEAAAQQHHDPHAAAAAHHAGGGHIDAAHATGDPHHHAAPATDAHAQAHHHEHHKVDSSGFVM